MKSFLANGSPPVKFMFNNELPIFFVNFSISSKLNSPLKRNVTQNEVGKAALFLLSDMSSGVTGENLHVDAGYHIVGMKAEDAPDIDVVTGRKE